MRLETSTLSPDEKPTFEDVKKALVAIEGAKKDRFVRLYRTELTFLQATLSPEGFRLACQFESADKHFTAKRTLSFDETLKAFELYFKGNTFWKAGLEFELSNASHHTVFKIGFLVGNIAEKVGKILKRK